MWVRFPHVQIIDYQALREDLHLFCVFSKTLAWVWRTTVQIKKNYVL
jgi:hypothetical protein